MKYKQENFKDIPQKEVIPKPKHSITKVYLGNYKTLEEAVEVQEKIKALDTGVEPFVKTVNGHYIVQLGSFADGDRAGMLADKLKQKGYYPKINYEN